VRAADDDDDDDDADELSRQFISSFSSNSLWNRLSTTDTRPCNIVTVQCHTGMLNTSRGDRRNWKLLHSVLFSESLTLQQ